MVDPLPSEKNQKMTKLFIFFICFQYYVIFLTMLLLQCYICERGGKQTKNNEVTHVSIVISLFLYIYLSIGNHKKK